MSAKNKSNEFTLTRVYDAPLGMVWDAWTDVEQVSRWWGPRGFSLTTHSKDLRTGGHWHYTMHGPDGVDYPNKTVYLEVDEKKRLVYDHGANDEQPPLFRVTVLFKEIGSKTQLEFTMACTSPEEALRIQKFIKEAGGNSTWDRLAEHLEKEKSSKEIFVINRSFEAPIEKVFEMWTNPRHFSNWMGPVGVRMENLVADIEVGKSLFYKMTNDKDLTMFGKISYQKIECPNYLQYSQIFCTEDGNVSRHPMVPIWPEVMLTKVWFATELYGKTRVTVLWEPQSKVTDEELQAFIDMKSGMTLGWTGSFDKLESYLLELQPSQ